MKLNRIFVSWHQQSLHVCWNGPCIRPYSYATLIRPYQCVQVICDTEPAQTTPETPDRGVTRGKARHHLSQRALYGSERPFMLVQRNGYTGKNRQRAKGPRTDEVAGECTMSTKRWPENWRKNVENNALLLLLKYNLSSVYYLQSSSEELRSFSLKRMLDDRNSFKKHFVYILVWFFHFMRRGGCNWTGSAEFMSYTVGARGVQPSPSPRLAKILHPHDFSWSIRLNGVDVPLVGAT